MGRVSCDCHAYGTYTFSGCRFVPYGACELRHRLTSRRTSDGGFVPYGACELRRFFTFNDFRKNNSFVPYGACELRLFTHEKYFSGIGFRPLWGV